jgi:hypothetical protein
VSTPKPEGFYVVLRDDDMRLHRHDVVTTATDEAVRLAQKEPGHAFYVVQTIKAVGPVSPPPKPREFLPIDSDIPF